MSAAELVVTLRSPALLAAAPPASNLVETLRFLPGNTLRGVLARRYLEAGGEPGGTEFARLFLTGEMRFGAATRDGAEPIPLSARSCKYEPGFRGDGGHGARDLLLGREVGQGCPDCGRPLDYLQGYRQAHPSRKVEIATRLHTRTAIDPVRGTARSGQLYSQRVLAEGQSFRSRVEGPEELVARLSALVGAGVAARVGGGSSRGQGWAEIASHPVAMTGRGAARERYERFRAAAGRPVLAVTLLSDGLFRDDYLRETAIPRAIDLAALGLDPDDWQPEPERRFLDARTIFGFDGEPLCLPRPPRLAAASGSCFLFAARPGREPAIPAGEGEGWIGEGHGEGHGRAVLWHPFHLDPEEEA